MGRGKVKEIVEHRITLGTYERTRLDGIASAWIAGRYLKPAVGIVSNPWAIASVVTLLEALGVLKIRDWIKENTLLDEWYKKLTEGLFASYDAAVAELEELEDLMGDIVDFTQQPVGTATEAVIDELTMGYGFGIPVTDAEEYLKSRPFVKSSLKLYAWVKTGPSRVGGFAKDMAESTVGGVVATAEEGAQYVDAILRELKK